MGDAPACGRVAQGSRFTGVIGMWRLIKHRRDDRGAAAVEFALVLPVLVLLLFGIIEFGLVFDAQLTITHAAREGARVASVGGNVASAVAAQTSGLTGVTYTLTPVTNSPTRGSYYEVTVRYTYPLDIPLWGSRSLPLKSTAQMRKEN